MSSTLTLFANHQVRLVARPNGMPVASDWQFTEEPVVELD